MVICDCNKGFVEELEVRCPLLDVGLRPSNVDHDERNGHVHDEQLEVTILLQVDKSKRQPQHAVHVNHRLSHRMHSSAPDIKTLVHGTIPVYHLLRMKLVITRFHENQ